MECNGEHSSCRERPRCEAFSIILHYLVYPGDVLEQHHVVHANQMFRLQPWLIFCSNRPLSAFFMFRWERVVIFTLGLYSTIFYSLQPVPIATFQGTTLISQAAAKRAQHVRFTSISTAHGIVDTTLDFGLMSAGCKLNHSSIANVSQTATRTTSTINFQSAVEFDGWFWKSATGDANRMTYEVHSSTDGSTWELLDSSQKDGGRACSVTNKILGKSQQSLEWRTRQDSEQEEQDPAKIFSFVSLSCLWPYYTIVLGHLLMGIVLMIAPLLSIFVRSQNAPVQMIAWCNIICSLCHFTALCALDRHHLPFGPISYSWPSLAIEATLVIFLSPYLPLNPYYIY
jgi:hypothetical protein